MQREFFACFWPYVGQSHGHIGWAKSMSFASINLDNPRTNPWNFHKKFLRIGDFEKWPFWKTAILIFFAWSPWKSVTNYVIEWMGLNFDVFPGFQQIPCYAKYYVVQCIPFFFIFCNMQQMNNCIFKM